MKKIEHFVCEVCGADYLKESDANKCEHGHFSPKQIKQLNYIPFTQDKSGYPCSIDCVMENGAVVRYERTLNKESH